MKIGFVLECAPEGPDEQVFKMLVKRLKEQNFIGDVECIPKCQSNKANLMKDIVGVVGNLQVVDRCDHVFVIWDQNPSWTVRPKKISDSAQIRQVEELLRSEELLNEAVTLICLKYELESWLISDERAFGQLRYGQGTPSAKSPRRETKPKDAASVMKQEIGLDIYKDYIDAKVLATHIEFSKLAKIPTFCQWFCKLQKLSPTGTQAPFCKC